MTLSYIATPITSSLTKEVVDLIIIFQEIMLTLQTSALLFETYTEKRMSVINFRLFEALNLVFFCSFTTGGNDFFSLKSVSS